VPVRVLKFEVSQVHAYPGNQIVVEVEEAVVVDVAAEAEASAADHSVA
jgi:hypothetical protein